MLDHWLFPYSVVALLSLAAGFLTLLLYVNEYLSSRQTSISIRNDEARVSIGGISYLLTFERIGNFMLLARYRKGGRWKSLRLYRHAVDLTVYRTFQSFAAVQKLNEFDEKSKSNALESVSSARNVPPSQGNPK